MNPELGIWLAIFKIVFGFALLIGIHEFGHAICAWLFKVKIHKFSIGMGPGFTFKNVPMVNTLIISPIVIGGYVQVDMEAVESLPLWKRMFFYSGGMLMNVLTGAVLLALIGNNFFIALWKCFFIWIAGWPIFFWALFSGQVGGAEVASSAVGPIGIGHMMLSDNFHYLGTLALLNVVIAMMNLLPIPPLDGGYMLRAILEKIIGKKWAMRVWTGLLYVGLPALLALVIYATGNDIANLLHPPTK
ncbi:MAG: site-2 protease family protein [bacterium]|nr:site-2 protease family protein [bacterium]